MINIDKTCSRDMNSKAVVFTNKSALQKHREDQKFKSSINTLKQDVKNNKIMLQKILDLLKDKP